MHPIIPADLRLVTHTQLLSSPILPLLTVSRLAHTTRSNINLNKRTIQRSSMINSRSTTRHTRNRTINKSTICPLLRMASSNSTINGEIQFPFLKISHWLTSTPLSQYAEANTHLELRHLDHPMKINSSSRTSTPAFPYNQRNNIT